jgi:hypothetical protein
MTSAIRAFAAGAAAMLLVVAAAQAQEPRSKGRVGLELNKLEQVDDACRVYLVLRNSAAAYDSFKLDIVLFDAGGVIARRVAVEAGPLRPERPTVKLFDVQGLPCERIGSFLVNDVLECRPARDAADCLALIEPSSRTDVEILR